MSTPNERFLNFWKNLFTNHSIRLINDYLTQKFDVATKKSNSVTRTPVKKKATSNLRVTVNLKFDRDKVQKLAEEHNMSIYRPGELPVVEQPVTLLYVPSFFQNHNNFPLSMENIIKGYRIHMDKSITDPTGKPVYYVKLGTKLIPRFQGGGYTTVKKGDTLSKIAKSHGMSLNLLLSLNKDIKKSDRINIGQKIKVNGGAVTSFKKGEINNTTEGKKVLAFQRLLVNAGYNIKVDGYWGKRTLAAYEEAQKNGFTNLNGNLVRVKNKKPQQARIITTSLPAPSTYNPWRPELPAGGRCTTEECAEWANNSLRNYKDKKNRILYTYDNIGGDAWTRLSLGKMVYSGYDGTEYDPKAYSEAASNKRNWSAADRFLKEFDSKTLDKNKTYLVNMYFNSSPNKRKAWKGALNGTTGTHTGNVYWNPETNSWRVAHNIHGILHDDDFILVLGSKNRFGYGITAIAEAPMVDYTRRDWDNAHPVKSFINKHIHDFGMWKKGGRLIKAHSGTVLPEVTVTATKPERGKTTSGKFFVQALNRNRNYMMKKYNLSDLLYADLSRFAVNIANRESKLGNSSFYLSRKIIPDEIISLGKKVIRGLESAPSRGLTQIKYGDDIKDPRLKKEYDELGITDKELGTNYDLMAIATIARALINQKSLGDKTYHYSDGTEIPAHTALAMYWNRGKLTDYLNENPSNPEADGVSGYARRFEHGSF